MKLPQYEVEGKERQNYRDRDRSDTNAGLLEVLQFRPYNHHQGDAYQEDYGKRGELALSVAAQEDVSVLSHLVSYVTDGKPRNNVAGRQCSRKDPLKDSPL